MSSYDSSPADDALLLLATAADEQPQWEKKTGGYDSHLGGIVFNLVEVEYQWKGIKGRGWCVLENIQ